MRVVGSGNLAAVLQHPQRASRAAIEAGPRHGVPDPGPSVPARAPAGIGRPALAGTAAFLAQRIAQEIAPETSATLRQQAEAGLAAYATAAGRGIAVIGSAGAVGLGV